MTSKTDAQTMKLECPSWCEATYEQHFLCGGSSTLHHRRSVDGEGFTVQADQFSDDDAPTFYVSGCDLTHDAARALHGELGNVLDEANGVQSVAGEDNHQTATLPDVVRVADALGVRASELVWFSDVLKSPALAAQAAQRGVAPCEFLARLVEFFGIAPGREDGVG